MSYKKKGASKILKMHKAKTKICSICKKEYTGYGNNAMPINDGQCCDNCNLKVISKRLSISKIKL